MAVLSLGKRGKRYALREDLDWDAIARLLWFYRWILLAAALAFGVCSFLFFFNQDRSFEATALVEINLREGSILENDPENRDENIGDQRNIEDTIVFLTSNFLLSKLANQLDLRSDDEFFSADYRDGLQSGSPAVEQADSGSRIGYARAPRLAGDQRDDATIVANLIDRLSVRQLGGSNVISIVATSINPAKAARIANSLAALHLEHQRETRAKENARAIEVLEERIEKLRGEVAGVEGQIIAYKIEHAIEDFDAERPETKAVNVQRAELATQLALAKAGLAEAEARRQQLSEKLNASDSGSAPASLISPALRVLKAAETDIQRRRSQLKSEFGAGHPLMVNLSGELAIVRERMRDEVAKIEQTLGSEVSVNLARTAELEAQLALLDSRASTQERAQIGLMDLKRRSETSRALLESLLPRYQSLVQLQHLDKTATRIMSPAAIPTEHVYPKSGLFSLIAATAGLMLACLGVFVYERWVADFGFTTMDQLRDFDLAPLGVVPELKAGEAAGSMIEDYVLSHPKSAQSEALQRIRTKLLRHEEASGKLGQVLLVTSSLPTEGKTSIAVILARQAAAAGARTLLIDADLRRPRVHDALGFANDIGLAEVLTGQLVEGELVRRDPRSHLDVLAAGRPAASPPDLFRSHRMSGLMTELRQHFEWIVIDSPPIGAVVDSLAISTHVDMCILVARWRETTRSTVLSSISQLREVHAPLVGVVLSRVDVDVQAKYGEADFGQYYGHYHDFSKATVSRAQGPRRYAA